MACDTNKLSPHLNQNHVFTQNGDYRNKHMRCLISGDYTPHLVETYTIISPNNIC